MPENKPLIYPCKKKTNSEIENDTAKLIQAYYPDLDFLKPFPIVEFVDLLMSEKLNYSFECHDTTFSNVEGFTSKKDGSIKLSLREDVYEKAFSGEARSRFSTAHELGHVIYHMEEDTIIGHPREKASIIYYENPEWQANYFAASLLASIPVLTKLKNFYKRKLNPIDLMTHCGLSFESALYRLKDLRRYLKLDI